MSDSALNTSYEQNNAQLPEHQSTGIPEADMYKKRIERSAYDADAWFGLLRVAKCANDDQLLNDTYAGALKQYPYSGHLLASFAELELSRGNKESAESIFNSNLFNVSSIELWKCYLDYVLRSNMDSQGKITQPECRATVNDCYKLVLENIGIDREAGSIWVDYIMFLNSAQTHAPYEEQQKMDSLRETYQAAVVIPMLKVEEIWKNYDAFETKIDRAGAKQILSKLSPSYMTARTALREMNKHWDIITKFQPPYGLPIPPEWTSREIDYLDAWRKYLKWEISNPLRLENNATLQQRVVYTYNQACMALRLYPEIWIEFADYLLSQEQSTEALAKLHSASQVLSSSLAVQFAYAEMAEKQKQVSICKQVYEELVERTRDDIDSTNSRYTQKLDKFDKQLKELEAKKSLGSNGDNASNNLRNISAILSDSESGSYSIDEDASDDNESVTSNTDFAASEMLGEDDDLAPAIAQRIAQLKKKGEKQMARIKRRMEQELETKREMYSLSWIMYLRFVQRSEGIDAVRQLLRRPRSDPPGYVTYHLFVAAALMEYHVAKRPGIAAKLFEYYAKTYSDSQEYIVEYMNYLINSGDDTNARALFERFQNTNTGDAGDMWSMYAEFEYNYGDMSAITKLDKRYIEKFEHESVLTRMAARYSYLSMGHIAVNEFGFPYRKDILQNDTQMELGMRRYAVYHGDLNVGDASEYSRALGSTAAGVEATTDQLANIAVGSVTGRYLSKNQLLLSVTSGRFAKPAFGNMEEYNPTIEPFVPPEASEFTADGYESRAASTYTGSAPHAHHLEQGDILSYIAASAAAPDVSEFDSFAINADLLLSTILQLPLPSNTVLSHYRPLAYMPWLTRADHHNNHSHSQYAGGSYHRGDRPSSRSPYNQHRSRSRGRPGYGDSDGGSGYRSYGSTPARHYSRGAHSQRQTPYSRGSGHSGGDGRSHSSGGSGHGYIPKHLDRGPYKGERNYR
ncbi:mRNA 3'-end-processing protein rna14 [Coemansia spiralis]|uniref:mRNA 3'-end-processing protein rna14 n=2 Tax=Coemansia TaxID=4863 RepID=A0A9W8KVS9_9FUNG|nr:hypothetical protein BX070DRAFT_253068 [Coemansia spiralis]KAJ1987292.1 mRNA 3'-end-processing protein rna14 [Coemansia umbellata]KAJ2619201.1 mRNA 3'-end-processing protein rna14 [Coemansia sp. RSA 1358]KAJ2670554.1 mRNA 3'-end-processing protein rna14 [Coemansia spiralis]